MLKTHIMKAEWVTTKGSVFAGHAYVTIALDIDPNDYSKTNRLRFYEYAQSGDLIVWDGHYGPNEENTPIEEMNADSTLILLKEFRPEHEYRPLNDMPFLLGYTERNSKKKQHQMVLFSFQTKMI